MARSYLFALLVITALMVVMIGRLRIGLMRMIANVVPIILIFGIMAIMNIPVDLMTTLIGSIVLGLVVDDTILTWEQNIKIATHGLTPKGYGPFDH